jgi:hypothetical protein
MANDDQRPAEAANRADAEQRAAQAVAELRAATSAHDAAMVALSAAAPAGGYGGDAA